MSSLLFNESEFTSFHYLPDGENWVGVSGIVGSSCIISSFNCSTLLKLDYLYLIDVYI